MAAKDGTSQDQVVYLNRVTVELARGLCKGAGHDPEELRLGDASDGIIAQVDDTGNSYIYAWSLYLEEAEAMRLRIGAANP